MNRLIFRIYIWSYHSLTSLILVALLEFFNASLSHTESKSFFLSSQSHEVLCKIFHYFILVHFQSLHELVFETFMWSVFSSYELHAACWALDHHFWAFCLDMIEKLCSGHVLKFFLVADIATEFRTVIDCMLLKIKQSFPNYSTVLPVFNITFMWELTKVDTIFENFVDIL